MAKFSIDDWKSWVEDADKARKDWLKAAEESWKEIKRERKNKGLWTGNPNSARKRIHYPFWWSVFKTRQPLLYSRQPIPIGKDLMQADDPTARTAAILIERLANGILRTSDFNRPMCSARDDYLIGQLGQVRLYYEGEPVKEPVKVRLTEEADELGNQVFLTPEGKVIKDLSKVQLDEVGAYLDSDRTVEVINEKICFEHVMQKCIFIDADATCWEKSKRIAFCDEYSVSEFEERFGKSALKSVGDMVLRETGKSRTRIKVFEGWDKFSGETVWFPETGKDFIKPVDVEDAHNILDLEQFFPCPRPLIGNTATDNFYPYCEYFQIYDLIDELHILATQMFAAARAIRCRFLYDKTVPGLGSLINELGEGDGIGIANLTQVLASGNGDLAKLIAYFPVQPFVESIKVLQEILASRLETLYQILGVSNIMRGQVDTTDQSRTFGEQQMQARFGMSRIAPDQEMMQEFARDSLQLACESALKIFSEQSLKEYMVVQTLDPKDRDRFPAALELLRNDRKRRFRVELETDSTIAINEAYDQQMRAHLSDALMKLMEGVAASSAKNPELAAVELKIMLHVVRGFRQGKIFEDEIKRAIESVIKKMEAAAGKDQPNPELILAQAEMAKAQIANKKADTDAAIAGNKSKLELITLIDTQQGRAADVQLEREKMAMQFSQAQAEYALKVNELLLARMKLAAEMQKAGATEETKRIQIALQKQIADGELALAAAGHKLKEVSSMLDIRERYITEARLQQETQLEAQRARAEATASIITAMKPETPAAAPVTVAVNPPTPTATVTTNGIDAMGMPMTQQITTPLGGV